MRGEGVGEIQIPDGFPDLLKAFTKAAIRTQPRDLLLWTVGYFQALANHQVLPTKDHLEYGSHSKLQGIGGATPGLLRVLYRQLQSQYLVTEEELREKWEYLCLDTESLDELLNAGGYEGGNGSNVILPYVIAWVTWSMTSDLTSALDLLCHIMSQDPDHAGMDVDLFLDLWGFLGDDSLGNASEERKERVQDFLQLRARHQGGLVYPKDLHSIHFPNFESDL